MKQALLATAALAALASTASAMTVVGVYDKTHTGYVGSEYVYLSPLVINGKVAPCLSPTRNESVGNTAYNYTDAGYLNEDNAKALTGFDLATTTIGEIGALTADIGKQVKAGNYLAADDDQGAIWWLIDPKDYVGFSDKSLNAGIVKAKVDFYFSSAAVKVSNDISFGNGIQAIGSVPEPATWAMMLIGFAGCGVMLRQRGRLVAE